MCVCGIIIYFMANPFRKILYSFTANPFRKWKPKGKMYSFRCSQCGDVFLSSHNLDAPLCNRCIQKIKSLDSTIDNEKKCSECGRIGVIYGKDRCHSCYFSFKKTR